MTLDHQSAIDELHTYWSQNTEVNVKNGSSLAYLTVTDHQFDYSNSQYKGSLATIHLKSDYDESSDKYGFNYLGNLLLEHGSDVITEVNTLHQSKATLDLHEGNNTYQIKQNIDLSHEGYFASSASPFFTHVRAGKGNDSVTVDGTNYQAEDVLALLKKGTLQGMTTFNLGDGNNSLNVNGGLFVMKNTSIPKNEEEAAQAWTEGVRLGAGNDTFTQSQGVVYTQGFDMGAGENTFALKGGTMIVADQLGGDKAGLRFTGTGNFTVEGGDVLPTLDVHHVEFGENAQLATFKKAKVVNTTAYTPATITFGSAGDTLEISESEVDLTSTPNYVAVLPKVVTTEGSSDSKTDTSSPTETPSTDAGVIDLGDGNNQMVISTAQVVAHLVSGAGQDSFSVTESSLRTPTRTGLVLSAGAGQDTGYLTKAAVAGTVDMGDGDDTLTVAQNTTFGAGSLLDGGQGWDRLELQQSLTAGGATPSSNEAVGLTRWEDLHISGADSTLTYVDNTLTSNVTLEAGTTLAFAPSAGEAQNLRLEGNLVNAGTVRLDVNQTSGDALTITGNYEAQGAAELMMNSEWDDSVATNGHFAGDALIIEGTASGKTTVHAVSRTGMVDLIDGDMVQKTYEIRSVPVIRVKQATPGQTPVFIGTARSAGIADYQLLRLSHAGEDQYVWSAEALPGQNEPRPEHPTIPPAPGEGVLILSPAVAGYAAMPTVNLNAGFDTLSSYRERWGQVRGLGEEGKSHRTSVRLLSSHRDLSGFSRLETQTRTTGVEVTSSLRNHTHGDITSQTAMSFGYRLDETDFADRLRVEQGSVVGERDVSDGKSHQYTLGLSHTFLFPSGNYLDLVAQASRVHNHFTSIDGLKATQRGWSARLSAEWGAPIRFWDSQASALYLEPQMQLAYQRLWMDDYSDGIHDVQDALKHALQARIGVRVVYTQPLSQNALFAVMNLHQRWRDHDHIEVGDNAWADVFNARWATFGLGMNWTLPIGSLYGEAHYERGLDGEKRTGWRGDLGWRISF